ncbi:MAG TPA: DedA family protein [Halothiobacillaceae bacterium]|nr:DedA family protein [Halothiobacillaceae bacterium]
MKIFGPIYDRVLSWSSHRHAPAWLTGVSFAESSFFPIPPDVMLMPMTLAQPKRWWWFALLATLGSAAGGLLGYVIGMWALGLITPLLSAYGYMEQLDHAAEWFAAWGFWAVLVAGFSPIPYKAFTITAGLLAMNPLGFFIASILGRGGRFFLLAGLIAWAGPRIAPWVRQFIEWIGWTVIALLALVLIIWQLS